MSDDAFIRYLAAKRRVDDRALNRLVWDTVARELSGVDPLHILEAGAGIGSMVQRLVEWRLIDARGFSAEAAPGLALAVDLAVADLFDFATRERRRRAWDLVIAQALLDVVNIETALPALLALCRPGGLAYFPITFDGGTFLEPEIDRALDDQIVALYHRAMDERVVAGAPSGDSRTGRRLFHHLRAAGAEVVAIGSSDWVIVPGATGYDEDDATVLHFILDTMEAALTGHPQLDPRRLAAWFATRRAQFERGDLLFIAHQLDVLARAPG